MYEIKGFYTNVTIDTDRYTKTLDAMMKVQMRQAAREWLRAVIEKVPVWTGMSRGSLKPLGRFLRVAISIRPVAKRKGMGPGAGEAFQSFSFGVQGTTYSFEFDEGVEHYLINEFHDVSHSIPLRTPGPYHSFEAGNQAFIRYVENEMPKRFPRVEKFIVQKRIGIR